mgnify:FL=1
MQHQNAEATEAEERLTSVPGRAGAQSEPERVPAVQWENSRLSTIGLASGTRDRAEPAVSSRRNTDFVYHRFFALGDLLAIVLACGLAIGLMDFIGRGSDITTVALTVALIGPVWFAIAYGAGQYHEIERRIDFTYVDEFGSVAIAATVWCWCGHSLRLKAPGCSRQS